MGPLVLEPVPERGATPVVTQWEESPNLPKVPREYHNLGGVFCKSRVTTLPPH